MTMTLESMPERRDLVLESNPGLDDSGDYTSPWFDSADILSVRVACLFAAGSPTVVLNDGQLDSDTGSDPRVVHVQVIPFTGGSGPLPNQFFAELDVTGRYFQVVVTGGSTEDQSLSLTIRAI